MTQAPLTESSSGRLVGQVLNGKYTLVRLLGEGGMGEVYLGEQKLGTTTRKVAVKTLHQHLSHDKKVRQRFDREVGTVAELQHPNTIQVYDYGTHDADGTLFIVMEFVEGRSCADILEREGPMPPDRVVNIMRQVCGSLEEAHGRGIVHRDLKPDNVVLAERAGQKDWVEVLDFGIAKRSTEEDANEQKLTQQGMVLGTPPYMSPEQFTGKPIDSRSDIYSLGVMAYEMLTGRMPFVGNTAWEWASAHMTSPPAPIETQPLGERVPLAMRQAISKALSKLPEDRFPSVKDFFDAFSGGGVAPQMSMGPTPAPTNVHMPVSAPPPAGGGGGRAKTEMGAPIDPSAAFGPSQGMTPAPASPMGFGPAVPAQPMPPPAYQQNYGGGSHAAASGGGGGKGLIIAAIAVLSLGVIGGGLYAAGVFTPSRATSDPLAVGGGGSTATATEHPTEEPSQVTPPPTDTVPPLGPSPAPVPVPQTGPAKPKVDAGKPPAPTPGPGPLPAPQPIPGPQPAPQPVPVPQPQPQPAPQPAPNNSVAVCTDAINFCKIARVNPGSKPLCESKRKACAAAGGNPPPPP